ncbi:MAG: hypothetical protein CM15mP55_3890 [Hyphomicrobiales bacterium]|nr:MAG: hypothetical protein CM15mP55_3890 [Hyphomicrobiales bacterium]
MLAAAGMRGVGYIADNWPKLKDAFRRQADQGLGPLSGLFASAPPNAPDAKRGVKPPAARLFGQHNRYAVADRIGQFRGFRNQLMRLGVIAQGRACYRTDQHFKQRLIGVCEFGGGVFILIAFRSLFGVTERNCRCCLCHGHLRQHHFGERNQISARSEGFQLQGLLFLQPIWADD